MVAFDHPTVFLNHDVASRSKTSWEAQVVYTGSRRGTKDRTSWWMHVNIMKNSSVGWDSMYACVHIYIDIWGNIICPTSKRKDKGTPWNTILRNAMKCQNIRDKQKILKSFRVGGKETDTNFQSRIQYPVKPPFKCKGKMKTFQICSFWIQEEISEFVDVLSQEATKE